jgi:hypothetical protein
MVIFGLVILLLAVLIVIAAVVHGGDPASLNLQLFTIKTNVTGVFVAGAVTLLLAVLGLALVVTGLRYDRRRRAQIKDLRTRASSGEQAAAAIGPSTEPSESSGAAPTRSATDSPTRRTATPPSSTGAGSTSADVSERNDGPDEYFESAPRDSG